MPGAANIVKLSKLVKENLKYFMYYYFGCLKIYGYLAIQISHVSDNIS